MSKPHDYQTKAIILSKTRLAEADRIITFFTPEHGKIAAVAKGVRRPNSRMSGHLEVLDYSHLNLARGHNLDIITGAQTLDSFLPLREDLTRGAYGLYAAEIVNQFAMENLENRELFDLFLKTLERLSYQDNLEIATYYFELHLLKEVGFKPEFKECLSCHRRLGEEESVFNFKSGGTLCAHCAQGKPWSFPLSFGALKVLRMLQDDDYEQVKGLKLGPVTHEIEGALRNYFYYLLEKDIKSASWLDKVKKML
jgi:DNA repair protein RecO (recombination protein O)